MDTHACLMCFISMLLKPYWKWLKPWHMVLIWEYSARAIQWIPTWEGLDGFQKSLRYYALDESSLSIGRVKSIINYPKIAHVNCERERFKCGGALAAETHIFIRLYVMVKWSFISQTRQARQTGAEKTPITAHTSSSHPTYQITATS